MNTKNTVLGLAAATTVAAMGLGGCASNQYPDSALTGNPEKVPLTNGNMVGTLSTVGGKTELYVAAPYNGQDVVFVGPVNPANVPAAVTATQDRGVLDRSTFLNVNNAVLLTGTEAEAAKQIMAGIIVESKEDLTNGGDFTPTVMLFSAPRVDSIQGKLNNKYLLRLPNPVFIAPADINNPKQVEETAKKLDQAVDRAVPPAPVQPAADAGKPVSMIDPSVLQGVVFAYSRQRTA